jgi:uncharacterized Zn finger protein
LLRGVARAATGADLAALWLREPAPEAALAALERTRVEATLPPALAERRRMLQADALAREGRSAAALALLEDLATNAADDLRVEILWREQDWPNLIAALEHALARRADAQSPLSDEEQVMVLKLALAHGRLGESAAVAQVQERFAAALRGQAIEPAFLMATTAPTTAAEPEAVLATAEQHLRRVRAYLDAEPATN